MGIKISAVQAALLIGRNERRIRDWIATQRLPATKVGQAWQIDTEDLERVPGIKIDREQLALLQTLKVSNPQGLLGRIADLEHMIQDLHTDVEVLRVRLDKLEHAQLMPEYSNMQTQEVIRAESRAHHLQRNQFLENIATEAGDLSPLLYSREQEVLPPGSIRMKQFALQHKVHAAVLTYQVETGKIEDTPVEAVNGRKAHWLTPQQQRDVITFWRRNGTHFVACPHCPHDSDS